MTSKRIRPTLEAVFHFRTRAEYHTALTKVPDQFKGLWHVERELHASGKKRFESWRLHELIQLIVNGTERSYFHEVVEAHFKTRLFFDLEQKKGPLLTKEEWKLQVLDPLDAMVREHYPHAEPPYVWSAHREGQMSSHVYYPNLWYETAQTCGKKVKYMLTTLPPDSILHEVVDCKPYPKFGKHTLRMPLCSKLEGGHRLVLEYGPQTENLLQAVCASLVTVSESPIPEWNVYFPQVTEWESAEDSTLNTKSPSSAQVDDTLEFYLTCWLKNVHGVTEVTKTEHGNSWHLRPGVYCPNIDRPHHTNCSYFVLVNSFQGKFTCTKCHTNYACEVNFSHLNKEKNVDVTSMISQLKLLKS